MGAARFRARCRPEAGPGILTQLRKLIVSTVSLAVVVAIIILLCAKVLNIAFFQDLLKKFGL